ncbi:MAG: rRNA maturation RNase YbeY [Minisyncoccia bacterium]
MTRRKAPGFAFASAKKSLLPSWDMSLVFVKPEDAQRLNRQLRRKTYTPNVLSYATDTRSGEIIICLEIAKEQAPSYELSYTDFVGLLFIHALLHLKGYRHGTTMDKSERAYLARLSGSTTTHGSTHRNRNRHRDLSNKGRHR